MSLKNILVHLDGSQRSDERLDYAIRLAAREDAHLAGLYVFDLAPAAAELVCAHRGDEWRLVQGPHAETVSLHARYADLAIVGQIDTRALYVGSAARVPEAVLLTSGRPLVVSPYRGRFASIGQNVVVAWKATAEASRALNDALPFFQQARKVTILTINPEQGIDVEQEIPTLDIANHLARHDVNVEGRTSIADKISTCEAMQNCIADIGADLLVMGGYGHTRDREAMFGGVTRQMLLQMTVPVLMSH